MKIFCPNCEKETNCHFDAELYSCGECGEDFANYEKPQANGAVKHMLELTSLLRRIMALGLLRQTWRIRDEALRILDGIEPSDYDVSEQDFNNQ